jgi:hypothetical protein
MTSATLNEDLSELKRMFVVGKVATLRLKEGDLPGIDQLEQVLKNINQNFFLIVDFCSSIYLATMMRNGSAFCWH